MFKKFAALLSVAGLICTLCTPKAFAQNAQLSDVKANVGNNAALSASAGKNEAQTNGSLKADIGKLVAEAKAGKRLVLVDPQNQPRQSNSLSKTTKIAIIAGIAIAVILIIVVVHEKNHLFDDFTLGN